MRLAACVFVAAAAVVMASGGHEVSAQAPTVLFGSSAGQRGGEGPRQAVERLESEIGQSLAAVRVYKRWDAAFPTNYERWLRDSGHTLFLSVSAQRLDGGLISWSFIANSQPDWQIYKDMVHWAKRIKGFGTTVYVLFDPEPETSNPNIAGTPADFVAAWQKFVTVFRDNGVDNARFVWNLTAYTFARTDSLTAAAWYPGDEYVDGIGADGYNFFGCRAGVSDVWRSFAQVFEPVREFGQSHPSEFLAIPEWGSVEDPGVPGRKAQWISEAATTLTSPGWEQFRAVLYWHSESPTTPPCEFWVDTSQSALDAFAAMGADPHFSGIGAPVIRSFSPSSGPVGTPVTLSGNNFVSVQSVTFNDVAATFSVSSSSQIVTTVPAGATAGTIQMTTGAGSATSLERFGVVHPRSISLRLSRHLVAEGSVDSLDGFTACESRTVVQLRRKPPHKRWRVVARPLTRIDGSFRLRLADRPGRYRAEVVAATLPSIDVCGPARSPVSAT